MHKPRQKTRRSAGRRAGSSPSRRKGGAPRQQVAFPIVGVGASAGGLEAYERLLRQLPSDTGMALLLVQHLDPRHESRLTEILARATAMPVAEVTDRMRVLRDHVYVIPPNTTMVLRDGILRLQPRKGLVGEQGPVDSLFRSLASVRKEAAVGVILSGTASDGAAGLTAIKAAGGITFAQDLASAGFGGMPQAAIATGAVDFVLPPEEIAKRLARLGRHSDGGRQDAKEPRLSGGAARPLKRLIGLLKKGFGVDFGAYKRSTIVRRIKRRMALYGSEDLADYARSVSEQPDELRRLYDDMFIGVTSFFREPATFEALKKRVFPRILRGAKSPVRIWVPGCSTGEEVYSLGIAIAEYTRRRPGAASIQLFGTDISEEAIQRARRGLYSEGIAREVGRARLRRFFRKTGEGYEVSKRLRSMCVFAKHDVVRDPPFSRLDLISCRNVLIYLDASAQQRLMPLFHYALKPSGFLLLGTAETIGGFSDLFALADRSHRVYAKRLAGVRPRFDFPPGHDTQRAVPEAALEPRARGRSDFDLQKEAADFVILNQYAPPAVLVNDHLEILSFRGRTGHFLEPSLGPASLNLMKMAREGLLVGLRSAFRSARERGVPARADGLHVEVDGRERVVSIDVVPLKWPGSAQSSFLVLFLDDARAAPEPPATARGGAAATQREHQVRVAQLKQELAATKAYLQSVIEGQQAGNEDLRSLNEELTSANEELQSTTEELETSNEELQSANEELSTLNEELQRRNADLAEAHADIVNLLDNMDLCVVIVDRELRVRRITPRAQADFGLQASDVRRPLGQVRLSADIPALPGMVQAAMAALQPQTQEARDLKGRWRLVQVRPYLIEGKASGALIALPDVHDVKLAEEKFRTLVESAPDAMVIADSEGRMRLVNQQVERLFGYRREELLGQPVEMLVPRPLRGAHRAHRVGYLEDARARPMAAGLDPLALRKDGSVFPVEVSLSPIQGPQGLVVSSTIRDVTERRGLETKARAAAVLEERNRLSRDVHDSLAHWLTGVVLQLESADEVAGADAEEARRHIARARELARSGLDAVRHALLALRSPLIDATDLASAIRRVAQELTADAALQVAFSVSGQRRALPPELEDDLMRIAQEALTNAVRHAQAEHVRAELTYTSDAVRVVVRDDGRGFASAASKGLGLAGMRERAQRIGAKLRIQTGPGKGTQVDVLLRVPAAGPGAPRS